MYNVLGSTVTYLYIVFANMDIKINQPTTPPKNNELFSRYSHYAFYLLEGIVG